MSDAATETDRAFSWPYTHPLAKPVEVLGDSVTAIMLREPTAADLLEAGIFDAEVTGAQMLDLIAKLAGKPPAMVRALPGTDMLALSSKLSQLFRKAAS